MLIKLNIISPLPPVNELMIMIEAIVAFREYLTAFFVLYISTLKAVTGFGFVSKNFVFN